MQPSGLRFSEYDSSCQLSLFHPNYIYTVQAEIRSVIILYLLVQNKTTLGRTKRPQTIKFFRVVLLIISSTDILGVGKYWVLVQRIVG